jgi:uncharacterized membrane protein
VNTLTVWRFDAPGGAEDALPRLRQLVAERLIEIDDAALVAWPAGHRKPSTETLGSLDGPGGLWGGFWGVLLALIFVTPIAGPAFGAAAGAVAATLAEFGVGDDFVKRVRDDVGPGSSALFVVSDRPTADRLAAELHVIATTSFRSALSPAQEQHLRDALGEESARPAV